VTDRDALIILNMISGIGPVRVKELLGIFDSPARLLQLSAKDIASVPGIGKKLAETVVTWKESVKYEEELTMVERAGVKLITQLDPEYPSLLKEIYDPPLVLYVHGELPAESEYTLGIVGSRRFSNYGRKMAEYLALSASSANWCVISGLAYGIDSVAHRTVVENNGKTVAVLGGGLARVHPQDHIPLAKEIIEKGGAVISEFPMTYSPNKRSFPMRNRIISGMSRGLLVVEAGFKSGSLISAKFALEQGRLVFAVPGQADNPQAKGTNSLIRDGAVITETFDDILNEFEFLPGMKHLESNDESTVSGGEGLNLNLSMEESEILKFLQEKREASADAIALESKIPMGGLLAALMQLEMKRLIVQLPGKRFAVK
jgi:DNA processing protein